MNASFKDFYHVTLKENIESIMSKGLVPQIGERSKELNEASSVFLFSNTDDLDNAVMNWLGDWYECEYGDNVELVTIKVTLPLSFPVEDSIVEYEKISKVVIPSEYITFFRED